MANAGASFRELLDRVRAGDQEAAAELVAEFEPQVRRVIRVRLTDPAMRRQLDSVDICQSVLGDFFVRSALGQFDLESPGQLVQLLATMARNKLLNHVERQRTSKRSKDRQDGRDVGELGIADDGATPSRVIAGRELLELAKRQFTPEEQQIATARAEGRSWAELAAARNETADGVRVRYSRAIQRIARALGLEGTEP